MEPVQPSLEQQHHGLRAGRQQHAGLHVLFPSISSVPSAHASTAADTPMQTLTEDTYIVSACMHDLHLHWRW